jgi:transposase
MKAYSVDLRTKIVAAHQDQNLSIRKTAAGVAETRYD